MYGLLWVLAAAGAGLLAGGLAASYGGACIVAGIGGALLTLGVLAIREAESARDEEKKQ